MFRYFVDFWESVRIALSAIRVNKMRTVLTSLGIIIGIASVTAMVTVINGCASSMIYAITNPFSCGRRQNDPRGATITRRRP